MPLRRRPRLAGVLATCGLLAAALSGCATSGNAEGANGYITGAGIVTPVAPADREDVPGLRGDTIDGGSVDIADYRGRIVVINIWASWCPPCRAEADDLIAAQERFPQARFVGIDVSDEKSAAQAFVREKGVPYPSIFDEDGSLMLTFYGMLSPDSLPSTFVIDKQGRIAALVLGSVAESTLVGLIEDVENET